MGGRKRCQIAPIRAQHSDSYIVTANDDEDVVALFEGDDRTVFFDP